MTHYKVSASGSPISKKSSKSTKIIADVVFGTPVQRCMGRGVCFVNQAGPVKIRWSCPYGVANIILTPENELLFQFLKTSLTADYQETYFGGGVFEVKDAYCFDQAMLSQLGMETYCIKPGAYEVKETKEHLTVNFGKVTSVQNQ